MTIFDDMGHIRKGVFFIVLLALIGSALFFASTPSSQQQGPTRYVSNTDPACGGKSPCYTTIQAAVNASLSGETIQIQAGSYPEKVIISGKNNVGTPTETDRIVIEADPAAPSGSVVITGATQACTQGYAFRLQQSKFITIRGLTITGTGGQAIELMGGNNQNQAIHIERNRIFGNGSSECNGGITIARGNPDTLIVNNLIYDNGRNGIATIDADGGPHYIVENTIHSNQWSGIRVTRTHEVYLINNSITQNGTASGSTGGRFGVSRESSTSPQPAGIHLLNNLICGNRLGEIDGPALDATDSGNLTPAGTEGSGVSASPGCEIPGNVYANVNGPDGLANTADDSFVLAPSSPAVDHGMDPRILGLNIFFNALFESDFTTEAVRPADSNHDRIAAFDIGAYEIPNTPPVANAGSDQSVFTGTLVSLNGAQSQDPEGANLTFQWTIVSQPTGSSVTLSNPTSATPTFTPLVAGNYTIQLIVNDGQLDSTPDIVLVTARVNNPPTANAGGPYTGQIGVPIQFSGTGNDPDGDPITFSWNFGDGSTPLTTSGGTVSNPTHTYTTAGIFTVTLTVTDSFGAFGTSQTTATVNQGLVLNPIGNKTVNLGETLIFTVSATSTGGTPSLFVAPLPLPNHATFNALTGEFRFTPDTTQVGSLQLTFSAVSGTQSVSETITITVPQPPPGGTTAVRGQVYNLNNTPLSNVKVTLKASGHTAFSDSYGFFTITGVPSGRQELIANGREANLGVFAILAVPVDLIEGVLNKLPSAITLPDVDVDAEVQVSPVFTTMVSNPAVPGVELEIPSGTATNSDGTPFTGKLSINPVPDYGRPESRPEELRPGMAITIQPAGVIFNPPARITFPNADNMPVGSELNLWSLSPDTGTFSIVGKMVVSADGQSIITVEGGVTKSAWHFALASSPSPVSAASENRLCGGGKCGVGSESDLEEGSLYLSHTLPSHRSLGQSRGLSLTYSSVTADPRPIVSLNTTLSVRAAVPRTFSTKLEVGGVQQGGEVFTDTHTLPEDSDSTSRISVQFDASNLPTGRYPYSATIFSNYQNSSIGGITNGNLILLNRKESPLGKGWAISDLQQLHVQADGTLLLTSGDGTALFFSGGSDTFTYPPGDFSTLVKNPDATYTRTLKDGTRMNFSSQGLETSVVDRNGNVTNYTYDGSGRLLTITDPAGLVATFTYSGAKLQKIADPAGRETLFQHDSQGNLTRITNPDGSFVSYAYDGKGHATQATDERGNATAYAYDFSGRFSQSTKPGGETRSLTSSKLQGLADTTGGQGTPTNPAPVVQSQVATSSLTDGKGNKTTFTLGPLGQIVSQSDALGQTTLMERDLNGLPTRITRPNGAMVAMSYDARGNLLTSKDPVDGTTIFTYEPSFNQVTSIRDPKGSTTTINYDLKGNPLEITDALNDRTQMAYTSQGLLALVTSAVGTPEQNSTSFTYDAKGNLLTTTDPLGNVTTLAYDNAGNVSRSTDSEGRVTEFTYDSFNRLISVLDPDLKVTRYTYDAKGNLAEVLDAKAQRTTFTYDALDRLISATNPLGFTETFVYDANGNLTSTTNRNGQAITFDYDALNRLVKKSRPPTSQEIGLQETTFNYDTVGNLAAVVNPVIGVFMQYDLANRLISSTSSTEEAVAGTVTQINADTTIGENDFQFDGRTLQVNGKTVTVDGSHTFANLILVNGAILTHSPTSETKVNKLDIRISGMLHIDSTSKIDVTGRGFLGGNRPGNPFGGSGMTIGFQAGSMGRSGGSYGGLGGAHEGTANPTYGDFRNPSDPGSGGGGNAGGSGGGLVRIVAQTIQLDGLIKADGETSNCCNVGGGSGGGIRIDVGTLQGSGQIIAHGGNSSGVGSGGGGGRVSIYYQNTAGFDLTKITAFGKTGQSAPNGGAGTVYLQGPARESGELIADNNDLVSAAQSTPILPTPGGSLTLTSFRMKRGAKAMASDEINLTNSFEISTASEIAIGKRVVASTINVINNSAIIQIPTTATAFFKVDLNADTLTVDATSRIDVTGRGFLGGGQPGNPFGGSGMTIGFQAGSTGRSGGSYGGLGGPLEGSINPVYGDFRNPNELGSGAGTTNVSVPGANGGGLIRIVAETLQLNGLIKAEGETRACCNVGGGSGGGIRIDAGTIQGAGQMSANGGSNTGVGGGGGGGRVAIYYQNAVGFDFPRVRAFGGTGLSGPNGGAGTVYLQGPARESGELIVDNNNVASLAESTPIPASASGLLSLNHLRVKRSARARVTDQINLVSSFEVASAAEITLAKQVIAPTMTVTGGSVVTSLPAAATAFFKVELNANSLTVDSISRIDATSRGFLGGGQPGNPFGGNGMTIGFQTGSMGRSGGSYGGLGGAQEGSSNSVYGDFKNPNEPGSGAGTTNVSLPGGSGGGLIRIVAQTIQLYGVINADGETRSCCNVAGGSGGGIRIDAGTIQGAGQITANGGNSSGAGGGGGGGRIAIYYQDAAGFAFSGATSLAGTGTVNGQDGTVYTEQTFAMRDPMPGEEPVMTARSEAAQLASLTSSVVQSASETRTVRIPDFKELIAKMQAEMTQLPQRRVYEPVPVRGEAKQQNLYLALLSNPKSKIENPKLQDEIDPIYTYDLNGNRTSMIDPTGFTNYTYDALNRLTSITNPKGETTGFTYDALGRRTSMTHGNGVTTAYSYDAASQLLSLVHQLGGTTVNSFNYTYDKVGNRKTKADNNGTANYTYDVLNRLVQATNPLPTNPLESFNYDPVGNRVDSNQNGLSTFNIANQLLEDANFTYLYDNNGNLTRKTSKTGGPLTSYEYDAENKLVRATVNGTTANYKYDGLGRRVEKEVISVSTTITRYIYDNEDILLELDGSNNITARYTHGPGIDEPLVMEKGALSFFYHADGLTGVTELTNQSGSVVQGYTYSSFGKIESQLDPNFVQPFTFTAREFDAETALYFYRARYYEHSAGQFLQEDPILHAGNPQVPYRVLSLLSDPLLLHTRAYVRNEPVDNVDPLGLAIVMKNPGWNGNYRSSFERQDEICTVPAWLGFLNEKRCTKNCCLEHDNCYTKYKCNASSWYGNLIASPGACQFCNSTALHCVLTSLGKDDCNCRKNE